MSAPSTSDRRGRVADDSDGDLTEYWHWTLLRHAGTFASMVAGLVLWLYVTRRVAPTLEASVGAWFAEFRVLPRATAVGVAGYVFLWMRHIGAFADMTQRSILARGISVLASRYDQVRRHEMKLRLLVSVLCFGAVFAISFRAGPKQWLDSTPEAMNATPSGLVWLSALGMSALLLLFHAADQFWIISSSRPAASLAEPLAHAEAAFGARRGEPTLMVAHLSDLHITASAEQRLIGEGHVDGDDTLIELDRLLHANRLQLAESDVVLVTGDMTDTGAAREWQRLMQCFRRHGLLEKLALVPGNHDTNIPHQSWLRWERPELPGRQRRLLRALMHFDDCMGERARIWRGPNAELPVLRSVLDGERGALLTAAANLGARKPGTTIDEFWRGLFPMVIEFGAQRTALLILDSVEPSTMLATNAFGRIGKEAWLRALEVREHYRKRGWSCCYSWHHHLAIPDQPVKAVAPALQRWWDWVFGASQELKGRFLVLQDASYVVSGLLAGPKTVVFHGHRHVDRLYSVSNRIEAVSAPSSTLGDEHGEHGASIRFIRLCSEPDAGISVHSVATRTAHSERQSMSEGDAEAAASDACGEVGAFPSEYPRAS